MADEMLKKLREIRTQWLGRGVSKTLNARMGIHTSICTVGNFGSQDRLDYTVIGNGKSCLKIRVGSEANKILISKKIPIY